MMVCLDIGGTKTRIALINEGKLLDVEQFATIYRYDESVKKIVETIERLVNGEKINGIGISLAAICSADGKSIISSVRLKDYVGKPFVLDLEKKFYTKCFLMNDAACAALGEAHHGAGKNKSVVIYITVSTGINGACVIDGKLNKSAGGIQFGHQIIYSGGRYWKHCGHNGCLEAYASGSAFEENYGLKSEVCRDPKIWDEFALPLAIGVTNVILLYAPEIVVIGGGVSEVGDYLFIPLNKHIAKQLNNFPKPPIVQANLGNKSGLVGAEIMFNNFN